MVKMICDHCNESHDLEDILFEVTHRKAFKIDRVDKNYTNLIELPPKNSDQKPTHVIGTYKKGHICKDCYTSLLC